MWQCYHSTSRGAVWFGPVVSPCPFTIAMRASVRMMATCILSILLLSSSTQLQQMRGWSDANSLYICARSWCAAVIWPSWPISGRYNCEIGCSVRQVSPDYKINLPTFKNVKPTRPRATFPGSCHYLFPIVLPPLQHNILAESFSWLILHL